MTTKDIKQIIELNENICSELHDYVESYVKWIRQNVDEEYWEHFGVKDYIKRCRFGSWIGFIHNNENYPCNWGGGEYWGNDFNLYIPSTKESITREFAKDIPSLLENGLKEIQKFNHETSEILKSKIQFASL